MDVGCALSCVPAMSHRDTSYRACAAPSSAFAWAPTLVRDEMKYWLLRPHVGLQELVHAYFIVEAGRRPAQKRELHLPDGYSELVFSFGAGFERAPLADARADSRMARSYVIAARSHSIVTTDRGDVRVIGVKLEPRMLRTMLGVPFTELRDSTVEVRELNLPSLCDLEDALAACESACEIVAMLDRFFLALRAETIAKDCVDRFVDRIRSQRGALRISDCVRDSGMDERTFERSFLSRMGMTPKRYARIMRFKHAYRALLSRTEQSDRTRANPAGYLDGYYDQSHFHKDFRFFTGTSPAAALASRSPTSMAVTTHLLQGDLSLA